MTYERRFEKPKKTQYRVLPAVGRERSHSLAQFGCFVVCVASVTSFIRY